MLTTGALALGVALTASCEDKALTAQIAAGNARIAELNTEVETQKRLAGERPEGDPVGELKEAEATLAETQAQVRELELQIEAREAELDELQEEFEDYKRKFSIDE